MKKILPIIIGIVSGLIITFTGVHFYKLNVAYGELNWWNETVAFSDSLAWKDIFGPFGKGKDLYTLVYVKRFVVPEKNALKDIAKNYGLTITEAKSVAGGSIIPLLNSSYNKTPNMTQEKALNIMQEVKESYEILNEAYSLQQEADTSIAPSEIFANNDLVDSGFDLIYDLSKIEEALFVSVTENTIGKPYVDGLTTPYLPTQSSKTTENYIASGVDFISGYQVDFDKNLAVAEGGGGNAGGSGNTGNAAKSGEATMPLGNKKATANVLEKDECIAPNSVSSALDNYEKESKDKADGTAPNGGDENSSGGGGGGDGGGNVGNGGGNQPPPDEGAESGEVAPAPKDDWAKAWCPEDPNVPSGGDSYGGLGTTFGDSGFTSLGDVGNSLLDNSSSTLTGAGAGFASKTFSAQASVCVTIKFIKKTLSSYYPGKGCVLCEVKKINDALKKTLDHSLIPNKSTGNMMESAKCKSAWEVSSLFGMKVDMKFVILKAPIPTSSSDDLILGKNIFESWKKFTDRYQPLLFNYLKVEDVTRFQLENAPSSITQDKVFTDIQKELAIATAKAKEEINDIEMSEVATNTAMYAQTLIRELEFMTQTFENYKDLFEKTNTVCQEWGKKPTIQ